MARVAINELAWKANGTAVAVVPGASVQVDVHGGSAATVYEDEVGGSTLSNPLTTDDVGRVPGWVEEGAYDLTITGDGMTDERTVQLFSAGGATGTFALMSRVVKNVLDYGVASGDYIDDALDEIYDDLAFSVGGGIYLPPGHYGIAANHTFDDRPIHLFGDVSCNSIPGGTPASGTKLTVDAGINPFTIENGPNGYGSRSIIENLHLLGSDSGSGSNDGILLRANSAAVIGCKIESFGRHGIHVLSGTNADPDTPDGQYNANCWYVERVRSANNYGAGFKARGVDSNAGVASMLDCSGNDAEGIYEDAAFGNTYLGPHLADNTTVAIRCGAHSTWGASRFLGIYKEGDSTPAVQIDSGNGGRNEIDFRVLTTTSGQTVTDNSATAAIKRTNEVRTGPNQNGRDNLQPGLVAGANFAGPTTLLLLANTLWVGRFVPGRSMTATKVSYVVSTAATNNDDVDVAIYDTGGNRIANKGATAGQLNSTGIKTITLTSSVELKPGTVYYVAMSCGTVGGTAATVASRTVNVGNAAAIFGSTLGPIEHGFYGTSHPAPSTVSTTSTANNAIPLMVVRED